LILERALETLEAPEHEQEKRQVITAIKDLGLKVTVGDVAQKSALPVLRVTQLLNNVAYETQGHLIVDTAGSVTYKFEPNFESHYLINPSKHAFRWMGRVCWNAFKTALKLFILGSFLLIRISFGVLLVASVVLVVLLIIAVVVISILSLFSSDSNSDISIDGGDGSWLNFDWLGGVRYWTLDWCWDWWYWGDYLSRDSYYSSPSYPVAYGSTSGYSGGYSGSSSTYSSGAEWPATTHGAENKPQAKEDSDFLGNCFSVLFGCGDANANWDEQRWGIVAQAIKAKGGVVIAEDLAPYLDVEKNNEDWMIPALVRFNGAPEVTSSGKIVYAFPALMPEAFGRATPAEAPKLSNPSSDVEVDDLQNIYKKFITRQTVQKHSQASAALPPYIGKTAQPLTGIPADKVVTVLFLASIASGGALTVLLEAVQVPFVQVLRPFLLAIAGYGALFYLLPALRWPFIANKNTRISDENEQRQLAAQKLHNPDAQMKQWQAECTEVRSAWLSGEPRQVAYSTEEDDLAQQIQAGSALPSRPTKMM
jgi:hypothetical protein